MSPPPDLLKKLLMNNEINNEPKLVAKDNDTHEDTRLAS